MKPMIFLNLGWMKNYKGLIRGDSIRGGGAFVKEHGYGAEIFNFSPYDGHMYGFVETKHRDRVQQPIRIERLGAAKKDNHVGDILAIWVARRPSVGTVIVGWYKNATVHRNLQPAPKGSKRTYKGEQFGYFVEAREEDCALLPMDERVFRIPRGKEGMGQSNVWYADQPQHAEFRQSVLQFINEGKAPRKDPTLGRTWHPDPYKRQEIEQEAIRLATQHYEGLGYVVDSVERDNAGWDSEASMDGEVLKLEVKGLSGNEVSLELTPNEYRQMQKHTNSYRICAVTSALSQNQLLTIFSFSPENLRWEDDKGNELKIIEVVSARMSVRDCTAYNNRPAASRRAAFGRNPEPRVRRSK